MELSRRDFLRTGLSAGAVLGLADPALALSALAPVVAPLILGSLMDLEERAIALEARAFTRRGPKTSLAEIHDAGWERALRWSLLVLMAVLVAVRFT